MPEQLSDFKSYDFAPRGSVLLRLIEMINDSFLRRAFLFDAQPLNAGAYVFAGDVFDHLREADNATRREYERRFERIFPGIRPQTPSAADTPAVFAEGNHDVGLGPAYSSSAQGWFASHFSHLAPANEVPHRQDGGGVGPEEPASSSAERVSRQAASAGDVYWNICLLRFSVCGLPRGGLAD